MSKKKIAALIVAFVVVYAIGFGMGDSSAINRVNKVIQGKGSPSSVSPSTPVVSTPVSTPTTPAPTPVVTPTPPPAATNKPTMTKLEFDQLKSGMTYEEATAIIGGPGEVMSESGSRGEPAYTVMYTYKGEGDLGANSNLMFQGNKLMNKAQFGLK